MLVIFKECIMKPTKTIWKVATVLLLVFTRLFTACQSTGGSQSMNSVKRDSEAVRTFERGEAFFHNNDFQKAIEEYSKVIEIEPEWAEAFIGRGNARIWGLDALEMGQEDFDKAAALNPQLRDYAQAFRYYLDRDYERAIETFNIVIQNGINLMNAYSDRGNSYFHIGEFEKAIADHAEAIRLSPNFYGNYTNRARVYIQIEQYDMAIADCEQAIRLYPNYYASYILRAFIYYQEDDFSRAIPDFSQAIQLRPDYVDLYLFRGDCYLQIGDYDKATADIDMALKLDPGNEDARDLRGEIRALRAAQ